MGRLITVVGNTGVGKTTLVSRLCQLAPFVTGLEQHEERPFQKLFSLDTQRYSLPNQVDYLLYRAEQELSIRASPADGLQDGGLDQDFYVFTRHFYQRGYLSEAEYGLCQRLYLLLRKLLTSPDLIIRLVAPINVIAKRFTGRGRKLEIARLADLEAMEVLLDDWLGQEKSIPVITVDASLEDPGFVHAGGNLIAQIHSAWHL